MVGRRTREQIIADILNSCQEGAHKTTIAETLGLNPTSADDYLNLLTRNGFLEVHSGKLILYQITSKGIELLKHLEVIEQLIPDRMCQAKQKSAVWNSV